jgi:hypothetical protein
MNGWRCSGFLIWILVEMGSNGNEPGGGEKLGKEGVKSLYLCSKVVGILFYR